MAKNNGKLVRYSGEINGYKLTGKISRSIAPLILTITLAQSLEGCTINEDDDKILSVNDTPKVETPKDSIDEKLTTDEQLEIMDEYVRYVENTPSLDNDTLTDVKNKIKEKYDQGKVKLEEAGVPEKLEKEKEEFLYSMNEIINWSEEKLIQNGIIPYDNYKKDYVESDKFLKDDKVNRTIERLERYMDSVDEQSGKLYDQLKIWFFGSELGKEYATDDSIYKKLLKFKEDYLTNRSTPYMTEEELETLENAYMNYLEYLINRINNKYGINIPIYVNYTEEYDKDYEEHSNEITEVIETFKII